MPMLRSGTVVPTQLPCFRPEDSPMKSVGHPSHPSEQSCSTRYQREECATPTLRIAHYEEIWKRRINRGSLTAWRPSMGPCPRSQATGKSLILTPSVSSSGVLARPAQRHRCPHPPSRHHCQSRCSGDPSQTLPRLQTRNPLGSLRQRFRRLRRRCRGSRRLHRRLKLDPRLAVPLQELLLTAQPMISAIRVEREAPLTSSAISFFVLIPLARKKFSSGCCSSLR